jgi:hypothetical protein
MTDGDAIDDRLNRLEQKVDAGFAATGERFDAIDRPAFSMVRLKADTTAFSTLAYGPVAFDAT